MLTFDIAFRGDGIELADVICSHRAGRGQAEWTESAALVFVRRGSFIRWAHGRATVLDPTRAYAINPEVEHRYDHHHDEGDACTSLFLSAELIAQTLGGSPELPTGPLLVPPEIDLAHRVLLSTAKRGGDPHEVTERAIGLIARTLEERDERAVASGRPSTDRLRRALVDGVREVLASDRDRSLPELARELSISPHHLSRVFRTHTGETISRHRMRLRMRDALERLAGGEENLAQVAAAAGFADESHLCRVVRRETGTTPAMLRAALRP